MYNLYYIGTGSQSKMYTLRQQFDEIVYIKSDSGEVSEIIVTRDYYIQNLSIDAAKAKETAAALGFTVALPKFTLEEIQKRTSEECEAARKIAEERFHTSQKMKLDDELSLIADHKFPFGRNQSYDLKELVDEKGDSWAVYWMKMGRAEDATATIKALGATLEVLFPEIAKFEFMDKTGNGKFFGQVGVRQKNVPATCVNKFSFEGTWGYTSVISFLTETGELLVYTGSGDVDTYIGQEMTMSFGIKQQGDYKGVNQTAIQRVKIHK